MKSQVALTILVGAAAIAQAAPVAVQGSQDADTSLDARAFRLPFRKQSKPPSGPATPQGTPAGGAQPAGGKPSRTSRFMKGAGNAALDVGTSVAGPLALSGAMGAGAGAAPAGAQDPYYAQQQMPSDQYYANTAPYTTKRAFAAGADIADDDADMLIAPTLDLEKIPDDVLLDRRAFRMPFRKSKPQPAAGPGAGAGRGPAQASQGGSRTSRFMKKVGKEGLGLGASIAAPMALGGAMGGGGAGMGGGDVSGGTAPTADYSAGYYPASTSGPPTSRRSLQFGKDEQLMERQDVDDGDFVLSARAEDYRAIDYDALLMGRDDFDTIPLDDRDSTSVMQSVGPGYSSTVIRKNGAVISIDS